VQAAQRHWLGMRTSSGSHALLERACVAPTVPRCAGSRGRMAVAAVGHRPSGSRLPAPPDELAMEDSVIWGS
jgi:hypothetical protein